MGTTRRERISTVAVLTWLATIPFTIQPTRASPEPPLAPADRRDALVGFENAARARTDWAGRRRADFGPDPYRLLATGPDRWVGLLRGADALVLLDEHGRERSRAPAPSAPTGLAQTADGSLLVVGEQSPEIARYRIEGDRLAPMGSVRVPGTHALRDVAVLGADVIVMDATGHRLLAVDLARPSPQVRTLAPCEGPVGLVSVDPWVVANCLLEGSLLVLDADGRTRARIVHDGPLWSVAGIGSDTELLVAAGGVENRPLSRVDGAFGYIDSFAFVYGLDAKTGAISRRTEVNLSALGVVVPKWLEIERTDTELRLRVAGYASEDLLTLTWPRTDLGREPRVNRSALPPGTTDVEGGLAANPLLDAWIVLDDPPSAVPALPTAARSVESRIGEALFFTTLMAPWNESEGRQSRFTCETCHHEGYVDGRTHYTGRDDVHATTKPLVGLNGNRPYFSRALDPTMARMVHNEFRVANKGNGRDPWFALRSDEHPWLRSIESVPETMSPLFLRRALLTFLMEFEHAPNPAARGRHEFTPLERRGADLFRRKCESCHAARLVSDEARSRVPFEGWEANLFSGGTIVWGRDGYEKTGVTPYMHAEGTRVPSLRRLYKKRPYFTNGSARDLRTVLQRVTTGEGGFRHDGGASDDHALDDEQRRALIAFLDLL